MNRIEATKIVDEALEQRRKFGKHYGVQDMPREFMDALLIEVDALKAEAAMANDAAAKGDKARQEAAALEEGIKELREQLTLANRQLGAAKSRETQLRKEVAALQKDLNKAGG